MPLNFSPAEVFRVARVCAAVRIGDRIPPYLQRFFEARLGPIDPDLAERVGALDAGQMDELCRQVRVLQRLRRRGRGDGAARPGPRP
jgi:hypothetical protein